MSASSSVFTFNEGSINEHPDASGPVTQAWETPLSIPSTAKGTTQDGTSDITREDYDRVASDNACLSHKVQELCQQMAHLLLQQQHVAAAVAQMQNKTTQPSTKPNKQSATSITESPEHRALMDKSFNSTTMKS